MGFAQVHGADARLGRDQPGVHDGSPVRVRWLQQVRNRCCSEQAAPTEAKSDLGVGGGSGAAGSRTWFHVAAPGRQSEDLRLTVIPNTRHKYTHHTYTLPCRLPNAFGLCNVIVAATSLRSTTMISRTTRLISPSSAPT